MANSETTFGDKLARGYTLQEAIKQMAGYHPPEDDITPDKYLIFLDSVDAKNISVATLKEQYLISTKDRSELFFNDEGVKKRASYVLAYCKSRSDLKIQTELIRRICKKIQNYKKPKVKDSSTNDKKRTLGEQSFGDFVKLFGDLIEAVREIPSYDPANDLIKIHQMEVFRTSLLNANTNVGDKFYLYSIVIKERLELYDILKSKMLRIKAAVKSQYGINSNEYLSIKGIRV